MRWNAYVFLILASLFLSCSPAAFSAPTLVITKVPDKPYVLPGAPLTYYIYYANTDPAPTPTPVWVDIVWLVDSSGSMNPYQTSLSTNAPTFFDSLAGTNFQLGVVNMNVVSSGTRSRPVNLNKTLGPPSAGSGQWTTNRTTFSNMVKVGTGGSTLEYGLVDLQETLLHYTFRPGTQKIFILVTDEEEFSGQSSELGNAISAMTANNVIVYAITNESFTLYCDPGSVTDATGGSCGDINLSDWSSTLDDIANNILGVLGSGTITDTLPADLKYVSSSKNGQFNKVPRRVDWSLGPMGAGSAGTLTLATEVKVTAALGSTITNTVQFFMDGAQPVTASAVVQVVTASHTPTPSWTPSHTPSPTWTGTFTHSPTVTPTPTPHPRLDVTKAASTPFVAVKGIFNYSLVYKNVGNVDAINTQIWDTLPPGIAYVDGDIYASNQGSLVTWDLTNLVIMPGDSGSLWIQVYVLPEALGQAQPLKNLARLSYDNAAMPTDPPLIQDAGPAEVFVTSPDQFLLDKNSIKLSRGEKVGIRLSTSRRGRARVLIYNSAGELVVKISDRVFEGPSAWIESWDGTNNSGEKVASGIYIIHYAGPVQSQSRRLAVVR